MRNTKTILTYAEQLNRFSDCLKKVREKNKLTYSDMALRCGVSDIVYRCYETGTQFPSIKKLIRIARKFNLSLDWLFGN